jgi:hypothetical protein
MSRRRLRASTAGAVVLAALAFASSASAGTWTTNGVLPFSALTTNSLLVIQVPPGHVAAHNVSMSCTRTGASGTLNASGVGSPFFAGSVTLLFGAATGSGSCSIGISPVTVSCQPSAQARWMATNYVGGAAISYLADIDCTITAGTCSINVTSAGTVDHEGVQLTYTNATGNFLIKGGLPSTQTLTATWSTSTACNIIFSTAVGDPHSGRAYFGSRTQTVTGFPDDLTIGVSSGTLPRITSP